MVPSESAEISELQLYISQIKNYRLLTAEEEIELADRIHRGDDAARQRMIKSNLLLVAQIARAYSKDESHLLDLIQEGNLGLLRATVKYESRYKVRFSTYASFLIRQAILSSLTSTRHQVRIPNRKLNMLRHVHRAYTQLTQSLHRLPTVDEISQKLGIDSAKINDLLQRAEPVLSMDEEMDDSSTRYDVTVDTRFRPDADMLKNDMKRLVREEMKNLDEKEREVLQKRFAFFGRRHTLSEIAEEMGISPETVRQIEIRSLKKLRKKIPID